jgi:hypothetical protein
MHLRAMVDDIGEWKDYRVVRIAYDIEFVLRAVISGKRFLSVPELTVFKFPSGVRKNVYVERPSHEQVEYARRIQHEPEFLYRELLAAVLDSEAIRRAFEIRLNFETTFRPGEIVENWRAFRGLAAKPQLDASALLDDIVTLIAFNPLEDITPESSRRFLRERGELPPNGVLIGLGWYGAERDADGPFRWVNTDAEILLTKLDTHPWLLSIQLWLGYANGGQPVTVELVGPDKIVVDTVLVKGEMRASFQITPPPNGTGIYTVRVLGSRNNPLPTDPRILNIGVRKLELEAVRHMPDEQFTRGIVSSIRRLLGAVVSLP